MLTKGLRDDYSHATSTLCVNKPSICLVRIHCSVYHIIKKQSSLLHHKVHPLIKVLKLNREPQQQNSKPAATLYFQRQY